MKITHIKMEKSRTIDVSGVAGRDAYRKLFLHLEAEVEKGDSPEECRKQLSDGIDAFFIDEINKINEANKQKKEIQSPFKK